MVSGPTSRAVGRLQKKKKKKNKKEKAKTKARFADFHIPDSD